MRKQKFLNRNVKAFSGIHVKFREAYWSNVDQTNQEYFNNRTELLGSRDVFIRYPV
jgi:hypothetical protein